MQARLDALRRHVRAGIPLPGETRRLLSLGWPEAPSIAGALVLAAFQTLVALAIPFLLARLLDQLVAATAGGAPASVNITAFTLIGIFALRAFLAAGHGYLLARAGERVVLHLRQRLYDHLLQLGPGFFDSQRLGALVSRLTGDVAALQTAATGQLASFFTGTITLIGAASILAWTSGRLAMLVLLVVPPVALLARILGRRQRHWAHLVQEHMAAAAAVAEETLGAIRVVQVFTREADEQQRFGEAVIALSTAALARAKTAAVFGAAIQLVTYGALVLLLYVGSLEVLGGSLTPGQLVAVVVYAQMIATSSSQLAGLYGNWSAALGAGRRVFELLDMAPEIKSPSRPRSLPVPVEGALTFEDVSFGYRPGVPVLHGIDLRVVPGETLALVGPSGAGKSTMMHLVARFYDPDEGNLSVDGIDLRVLDLAALRGMIGLVPQEPMLFHATIAENLRYGRPDASQEDLENAARAAHAHDFVSALEYGYRTVVGERGVRLSAGERQRITIARALLADPRILLLDEATSSLDSRGEALVQAALERLMAGRTTLVIAHRLSTVLSADRIAVLDRGRIVELGDHRSLLALGGLYAQLYQIQFREGFRSS
jgi:ATP-binding cassette, subfamily B, bacterial MsbA